MLGLLARNWWMLLINGIGAVGFGLLTFWWPGMTLLVLVMFYGCFCLVDGISAIGVSFVNAKNEIWWEMLFIGLLSIVTGVTAVLWPGLTGFVLLMVIAVWAIVRGVMEIRAAFTLRRVVRNEWLLATVGAASLLLGIILLLRPGAGALIMVWAIGASAIVRGSLLIGLALRLRGLPREPRGVEFTA